MIPFLNRSTRCITQCKIDKVSRCRIPYNATGFQNGINKYQYPNVFHNNFFPKVNKRYFSTSEASSNKITEKASKTEKQQADKQPKVKQTPLHVLLGGHPTKGLPKEHFIKLLESYGINRSSPKFKPTQIILDSLPDPLQSNDLELIKRHDVFVSRALDGDLVIKDFDSFSNILNDVYNEVKLKDGGKVAQYIPQLAKVNPEQFGSAVCSIDGQQWKIGDSDTYFCIQSISKAITYLIVLEEHGQDVVHSHVGREPSGAGFNERILNAENLPHNPYLNSGAIMCCSLIKPNEHISTRFDHVMDIWSKITGGARPTFANSTYLSEKSTADRNFCLAYMMHEAGVFPKNTDLIATLDLYFMLCSIEVTADMLAVAAGTLASGGVCPLTGERVFSERSVRDCLSLVASCGMYDASGEFIFDIGIPAKSGVAGGLLIVIPGTIGMCTWSPRLESHGNSYRGVRFCEQLVQKLDYHQFSINESNISYNYQKFLSYIGTEFLFAIYRNDISRIHSCVAADPNVVNFADYDKRTPLHIAASVGNLDLVKYLIAHGAKVGTKDYLNHTPADDAKRNKFKVIHEYLTKQQQTTDLSILPEKIEKNAEQAIFSALDNNADGKLNKQNLTTLLTNKGIIKSVYWKEIYDDLDAIPAEYLNLEQFSNIHNKYPILSRCVTNNLAIAEFDKFTIHLQNIYKTVVNVDSGAVASHIPKLASIDPEQFEVSFCSSTGQLFNSKNSDKLWSVQAITNIVNYIIAQELLGEEVVHQYVGKESSGRNSNDFTLDAHKRPHNPAITAGALTILSLIKPKESKEERLSYILSQWNKLVLNQDQNISFDGETYISEMNSISRKWTLAYMLLDSGVFPDYIKSHDHLKTIVELYFMTLSILISTEKLAIIGAVLANGGLNPFTRERLFNKKHVRNALSIMSACGMYDWSGEFTFHVGIPAQSGVGGGILAVVPNLGAFCTFSPRLDNYSISVRGVQFYRELTKIYNFHVYEPMIRNKLDPTVFNGNWNDCRISNLLDAASNNDLVELKKELAYIDVNSSDYDGRTALHVAAENGHKDIIEYLLRHGADINLKDRWGHTAQDCTKSKKLKALLTYSP